MTYDELADILVEISVDTSDPLNTDFQKLFSDITDKNMILREIIYLKVFFATFAAVSVSTDANRTKVEQVGSLMLQKTKEYFDHNDCGCKANYSELASRFECYWDRYFSYHINRFPPKLQAMMFHKTELFYTIALHKDFLSFVDKEQYKGDYNHFTRRVMDTYNWVATQLEEKSKPDNTCYIATATYNNPMHPDVIYLRGFRDHYLNKTVCGRLFIKLYYMVGPYIAVFPKHFTVIKKLSRSVIEKIVILLKRHYT